ncbi:organic solute transporter Ostalpha-domain-containing protein [Schizophyllum commune]
MIWLLILHVARGLTLLITLFRDQEGSSSHLPTEVLILVGVSIMVTVVVSAFSTYLHTKNSIYLSKAYYQDTLRIMVMIPIYADMSPILLFAAFLIYCFFVLQLVNLGGEHSLLITTHGWPPNAPCFPMNITTRDIDVSDSYTFLFLKGRIMQHVRVTPTLATATLILKSCNKYNDGDLHANSGHVSVVHNVSICLALYCLAIFWLPQFLSVKGTLPACFRQLLATTILVVVVAIARLGPYTDAKCTSLGLSGTFFFIEIPFFAIAHWYPFSFTDFVDEQSPREGFILQGLGREAGLCYSKGGSITSAHDDNPVTWAYIASWTMKTRTHPLLASEAANIVHATTGMCRDSDEDV